MIPVGITAKTSEEDRQKLMGKAEEIVKQLGEKGIRVEGDLRENVSPTLLFFNYFFNFAVLARLEVQPLGGFLAF